MTFPAPIKAERVPTMLAIIVAPHDRLKDGLVVAKCRCIPCSRYRFDRKREREGQCNCPTRLVVVHRPTCGEYVEERCGW